jgi:hypothetical protein
MKEIKYIEKEPLLAWLEHMCVSENIIKMIADENRFPTVSVLKIDKNDFPKNGDDIYYVNDELGEIEHGTIYSIHFKNGEIDTISVDFDNGDFDEFYGSVFGNCMFPNEEMAKNRLINNI